MSDENYERAEILKSLMKQCAVKSVTVSYSGSLDSGSSGSILTVPELLDCSERDRIYDAAENLMLAVVKPNFNGAGSSGEMTFSINDDDRLAMVGDHHRYTKYVDVSKYEATFFNGPILI